MTLKPNPSVSLSTRFGTLAGACLLTTSLAFAAEGQAPQGIPVQTLTATAAPAQLSYKFAARFKAAESVSIVARTEGEVKSIHFSEGSYVEAGQPLFKLDPMVYQLQVNEASALLNAQQANFNVAESNWKRASQLYQRKAISARDKDQAEATWLQAKASLAASKTQLQQARLQLSYTQIKAPISGNVQASKVDKGDWASPSLGSLTTILSTTPAMVDFSIPDTLVNQWQQMVMAGFLPANLPEHIKVNIESEGKTALPAKVTYFASEINPMTASFKAEATATTAPEGYQVFPGQFTRLTLGLEVASAISVPQKVVMQNGPQSFVYVVGDGKANFRPVTLGPAFEDRWIITSGLQGGEQLVANNLVKVRPGAPVTVLAQPSAQ